VVVPRPPGAERPPAQGPEAELELRDEVDPDAVHSVIHTSGTTGEPKPVELTYRNHHASALATAAYVRPDDRWLCCVPVFHVAGLGIFVRGVVHGFTVIAHERFDAGAVRRELERGVVTLVSLVPTMLRRLLDAGLREAPVLRSILLGGAPVPPDLLDCGLPVVPVYGLTETASQVVADGAPLPGAEVSIGEGGEILVRGPMVAPAAISDDGWLHTGDLGMLYGGRLRVEGRSKDLIVTGGENVAPVAVEHALAGHPAVADVAVVGLEDPDWGEAVTAFVVLGAEVRDSELLGFARERLRPHEVPKRLVRMSELPRTPNGKLLRDRLPRRASN
jgi:o-succinylbenzoate---CoA ligase